MAEKQQSSYNIEDVVNTSNKILKWSEEQKMNPALLLHSLIFTTEYLVKRGGFVPKQIADIRRASKKIIDNTVKNED